MDEPESHVDEAEIVVRANEETAAIVLDELVETGIRDDAIRVEDPGGGVE